MTQENKDLLLRDLCARLPYEVKVQYEDNIFTIDYISAMYEEIKLNTPNRYTIDVLEVKPYLFPLSSMTEEQQKELYSIQGVLTVDFELEEYKMVHLFQSQNVIDWFNKNHFDYRGLIEKGLAIDSTDLNIY